MPVLKVTDLSKVFYLGRNRKVTALDKVSFEVEDGEIFGILGPNGSGKTTCLKLLLGILFPTEGKIDIMGKNQFDVRAKEKIGFLPENPYYYEYLSGAEVLNFYGRLFGMPAGLIRERTEYLLKLVNLQDAGGLALRHYSKGMLERIGLASSLINDPKILILDEPTTGLDPIGCKETRDLLVQLKEIGKTVLLSSHFLSEVERVCSRIAIFHKGSLLTTGVLADLLQQYRAENLEDLFVKTIQKFDAEAGTEKTEAGVEAAA